MLRDLSIKGVYSSDEDDILNDFYIPAFFTSVKYQRSVGYFSAATLSYAAQALTVFIENGGEVELVVGAFVDHEEMVAVQKGYDVLSVANRIGREFVATFDEFDQDLFSCRLTALAWLVANDKLKIKVALRKSGIFHEKVGILTDQTGDQIVFTGSANETAQALLPQYNFESIDVYKTWRPEYEEHWGAHLKKFNRLWQNESKDTAVIDFPNAARDKLVNLCENSSTPRVSIEADLWNKFKGQESNAQTIKPRVPKELEGRPFEMMQHQKDALNNWKANDCVGILALATGTGKTITSIYSIVKISEIYNELFVVVSVPYQNLADQWCDVFSLFNIFPIRCYVSQANWLPRLQEAVSSYLAGVGGLVVVVVVNRTLVSETFQNLLRRIDSEKLFIIGDECHHQGSDSYQKALPLDAKFKLGLSATPEHYFDEVRNQNLSNIYGLPPVYEYSLERAIREKILTPYDYHVEEVSLTPDEAEAFIEVSRQISAKFASIISKKSLHNDTALQALLRKRSRIIDGATNKITALRALLDRIGTPIHHSLFYCGDSSHSVEDGDDDEPYLMRQVEVVSREIGAKGWSNSHFTSRENRRERNDILQNFKEKYVHSLVAIRCLDEGIDIPACDTAFILASQRDPRQFIQRRGRILRKSIGKTKAVIYDFLVRLPHDPGADELSKKLLESELKRVAEFSRSALNKYESYDRLRDLLLEHSLEHLI
jgi:superfamily II DNA or RNA helicase